MSDLAVEEGEDRKRFYAGEPPKNHNQVARPLPTLEKLLQQTFENMAEATEKATQPFRIEAGLLLAEARSHSWERFDAWVARFKKSPITCRTWIREAKAAHKGEWQWADKPPAPNKGAEQDRDRRAAAKRSQSSETRESTKESRAAEKEKHRLALRKMCWRVINAGYKVIATEVHPDKGGSEAEFKILGEVKEILEKKYKL